MGEGELAAVIPVVACVYKSGRFAHPGQPEKAVSYGPDDVSRLQAQVAQRCRADHRFVCLTDCDLPGVETIRLRHGWPGWWSKMELFLHLRGALYLDLDTAIVGDITDIVCAVAGGFSVLRNLSFPRSERIGSGVMKWSGDYGFLYRAFARRAAEHMDFFTTPEWWGDQGFIRAHLPDWRILQDEWPGAIVSFNKDMKQQGDPPAGARIVCFHGQVKPRDVAGRHEWLRA